MHHALNLEAPKLRIRFTERLNNQNNSRQEPAGDDFSESNSLCLS